MSQLSIFIAARWSTHVHPNQPKVQLNQNPTQSLVKYSQPRNATDSDDIQMVHPRPPKPTQSPAQHQIYQI